MLIDKNMVFFSENCNTAEEAIRTAGTLLVQHGYAKETYVDSMVNNYMKNGPYFVLAPGLAMPHGRPEDGVIKTGISVLILDKGVEFGNGANDPVQIVIGLATANNDEHLRLISNLAKLLNNNIIKQLAEAKTSEQVIEILNS
jgi:mannitol/fructose-specific phosphotransferase system IIA component (Ntr-type)